MLISKSKLKNIIKKAIIKEVDDYLQDFTSFSSDENKRNLRNYLTSKNLSNTTIGPSSIKNFPKKGVELSLRDLIILRDLNFVEVPLLKQSLDNSNIKYKVENNVFSFSKKDAEKIVDGIRDLLILPDRRSDWVKTNYTSLAGNQMTLSQWRELVSYYGYQLSKKIKNQKKF